MNWFSEKIYFDINNFLMDERYVKFINTFLNEMMYFLLYQLIYNLSFIVYKSL